MRKALAWEMEDGRRVAWPLGPVLCEDGRQSSVLVARDMGWKSQLASLRLRVTAVRSGYRGLEGWSPASLVIRGKQNSLGLNLVAAGSKKASYPQQAVYPHRSNSRARSHRFQSHPRPQLHSFSLWKLKKEDRSNSWPIWSHLCLSRPKLP